MRAAVRGNVRWTVAYGGPVGESMRRLGFGGMRPMLSEVMRTLGDLGMRVEVKA